MKTTQKSIDGTTQRVIHRLRQKTKSTKRMFSWTSLLTVLALVFMVYTWVVLPAFSTWNQLGIGFFCAALLYVFYYSLRVAIRNWKGDAQLKKDLQQGQQQILKGKITAIRTYQNSLEIELDQKTIRVYMAYSFCGFYRLKHASALLNEAVELTILPHSHVFIALRYPGQQEEIIPHSTQNQVKGVLTLIVSYQFEFFVPVPHFLRWFSNTRTQVQVGNKFLTWFKKEIPPIGKTVQITIQYTNGTNLL